TLPLTLSFPPASVIAFSLLILFSLLLFPHTQCINVVLTNQHSLLPNRKTTLHHPLFSGKRILFFFLLHSLFCSSFCRFL
ncbi:hypothetical protein BKA57DRAFT_461708, partial [Linnemannia elongata]